jgi:hypothetical protein
LLFELRIQFTGDEGDEMSVLDLNGTIEELILDNSTVDIKSIELYIFNHHCENGGRKHATRYQSG